MQYKLEANFMFMLNKALYKTRKLQDIRFSNVRYLLFGVIYILLIKKADARLLVSS